MRQGGGQPQHPDTQGDDRGIRSDLHQRSPAELSRTRVGSALEARTSRMIAAMDLRVAVLAGAPDHAWTLSSPQQRSGSRLPVAVERGVMTDRQVVALLTK